MSGMINNLGTKLFKSVADKAGDLGEKFEEEFSKLALNITSEVDTVVTEVVSLSGYIKVALVILCILLILMIIRLSAFGIRCIIFKARDWMLANENRPPPQVILMMPQDEANDKKASRVYSDVQTKNILDKIQQESMELFSEPPAYKSSIKSGRSARLTRGLAEEV